MCNFLPDQLQLVSWYSCNYENNYRVKDSVRNDMQLYRSYKLICDMIIIGKLMSDMVFWSAFNWNIVKLLNYSFSSLIRRVMLVQAILVNTEVCVPTKSVLLQVWSASVLQSILEHAVKQVSAAEVYCMLFIGLIIIEVCDLQFSHMYTTLHIK